MKSFSPESGPGLRRRTLGVAIHGAACMLAATIVSGGASAQAPMALRWTAATPDAMVDAAFAHARSPGDDALAGLVVASALDDRASFGHVRDGLAVLAASGSPLADDARWLNLRLLPAPVSPTWSGLQNVAYDVAPDADGLVKSLAILGPFQDTTGNGLMRLEGPEAPGQSFSDASARYAWGVYDVAWRRVFPAAATPRGVPLDLYVHPRSESCTYLASKVTVPADAKPMVVHVAATGAVRLIWDGANVAVSEDLHAHLVLDRMAARIEAAAGPHLLAVKVCSAAVGDDGRVRLRLTDEQRRPLALATSSDLRGIPGLVPQESGAHPLSMSPTAGAPQPAQSRRGSAKSKPAAPHPKAVFAADTHAVAPKGKAEPTGTSNPGHAPVITPPKGVTVVQTSLEKALAATTDVSSAERALVASILRVLGGADDARSPRAPGLLDAVTGRPGISPDILAMAGWISPFGANRSGWLNLARSRAAASHDDATAGFAQRRLVATHLTSRYVDWAISTAAEEPLASATDAEARLIRALVKKQLGGSGFRRAALDDLRAVEASLKERTPVGVVRELADLSRGLPAERLRLLQRLADTDAEARGAAYVDAFRTNGSTAMEIAAAANLLQQTSADDLLHIGHGLLGQDRYAWAREVFAVATLVAPNRSAGFVGLAAARRVIAAEEARRGEPSGVEATLATANLTRARDLDPADASLKAEAAFRRGSSAPGTTALRQQRDEEYIVKPEVFLQRGREKPVRRGEIVDRQLHWVRVVTYHADKRVSQLMHYSREIVIEPRTENDLYENTPSEGDETELLFARVHKKDGTVVMPEEQSSGGRKPAIRWPDLKAGDVVEVAVRSWTSGPVGRRGDAPFWFVDYVGSTDTHPILFNQVVVDSPMGAPLAIDVLNGKADRVAVSRKDDRVVTTYTWDNPPSVRDEPLAPKLTETLPIVVGSTFANWADFREWYRAAVKGFTEPDEQVRKLAAELTLGKKTREEKLRAVFEFVADDIRYVNYVSGEWWLPNRPQELLARRQGDCDDKALLLITLLKAIGIDATEVLVQTRYTAEPSLLRGEHAAIPVFDHGIAYLPGAKGQPGIWLDATSPESRLGPLPSMDARTLAFFIDEGPAKIVGTPASNPEEHGVDADWTITLSPSGAGELVAHERHTGDAAFELRMNLKQPDARTQWVEQYLASGWFPTVQITGDVAFKPDLPKGVATLSYNARSQGLARREGQELAVPTAETSTLTSQLAPLVQRTLPVVLPARLAPGHETRKITIVAPPGYAFADLPPNGDEPGGEFGSAHLEFTRPGGKNAVVVKRSVVFDLSTIPVDKYQKWRAWLQRVDGLMHRTMRLTPIEAPSPAGSGLSKAAKAAH